VRAIQDQDWELEWLWVKEKEPVWATESGSRSATEKERGSG
jgi:hypothetical protein